MSPTDQRDDELGAALRKLQVPEHRADFFDELELLLDDEDVVALRRRPAARPRRRLMRVALAAAAVAAVALAIGLPQLGEDGPEVATAAEIKAEVRAALAGLETLSGVLVSDGPQRSDVARWRFVLTADGDLRLEGPTRGEVVTYDAARGVARSASRSASIGGETLFYSVRRGLAPGLPDQGPPTWILPEEFGSFARALLAAEDPTVEEIVYEGRPAWRLEVDAVPNAIVPEFTGDRFEITVDQETGLPVRVVETRKGEQLQELRLRQLEVNGDVPAGAFRLDFPTRAEVSEMDEGFRRLGLDEAAGVVGYAPLVPAWIPEGYEAAEVAVAREAFPTGSEAGNPVSRGVVSLSYRRGFDQFIVTTRLTGESPDVWSDPLATGEGFVDERQRVRIRAGALEGERAEIVIVPRAIPHLWSPTDELVVTVGGDLSRAELVRIAESLERR
jgi:outer membrane lipoprotein-sorting protein